MIDKIKELYKCRFCNEPDSIIKLTGDGSNRVYYRVTGSGVSVIAAVGTSFEENRAFVALADSFAKSGVRAPEVLAVSDDGMCYLQEDLGDVNLFQSMKESRDSGCFSDTDVALLCDVMSQLPHIQFRVPGYFDFSLCYPVSEFDSRAVMWDLNYFK